MTVGDLVEKLKEYDPQTPVIVYRNIDKWYENNMCSISHVKYMSNNDCAEHVRIVINE